MPRTVKLPGAGHPIAIAPFPGRVVVTFAGVPVAESRRTLRLTEAGHPPVHYFPREDVAMAAVQRSETVTWCPYKGEATHFTLVRGAARAIDAGWSYEAPHAAVAAIAGHLAFYPGRVDGIAVASGEGDPAPKAGPA
ncbi:MAG: DUF427 domain-containing protein [Rhodobacteraceae bacterium]|nr:DUF427 domain-containing protein [Paracoccaceae bacterium]